MERVKRMVDGDASSVLIGFGLVLTGLSVLFALLQFGVVLAKFTGYCALMFKCPFNMKPYVFLG